MNSKNQRKKLKFLNLFVLKTQFMPIRFRRALLYRFSKSVVGPLKSGTLIKLSTTFIKKLKLGKKLLNTLKTSSSQTCEN